jgi:hypothetical protein
LILTKRFLKRWQTGRAFGPIIIIDPEIVPTLQGDITLTHELTHAYQWYRTFGMQGILYLLSKRKRLEYEIEAYGSGLQFITDDIVSKTRYINTCVYNLYMYYNLGYNVEYIYKKFVDSLDIDIPVARQKRSIEYIKNMIERSRNNDAKR